MPQVRVGQRRQLGAILADQGGAFVIGWQPALLDRLPVQFGARVGRGDRDLEAVRVDLAGEPDRLLDRLPGFPRQAVANGWLPEDDDGATLVSERGTQLAALSYPHLGHTEILESVDAFYKRFYFRAGKIAEMSAELFRRPDTAARRLREGGEFVRFLSRRPRHAEGVQGGTA